VLKIANTKPGVVEHLSSRSRNGNLPGECSRLALSLHHMHPADCRPSQVHLPGGFRTRDLLALSPAVDALARRRYR
jgi:hypothetical protein